MSRPASAADVEAAGAAKAIPPAEAKTYFNRWNQVQSLVIAVSGGPDSMALLWLAARWRKGFKKGPLLTAVTIDHGLRNGSAREARTVKSQATALGVAHRTLRWQGVKPETGVPAAAREARYRLLIKAARAAGATHIATAHTRDDQAETMVMRLARGSGLAGLAAMSAETVRDGMIVSRPLLEVPKSRLIATLQKARVGYITDPTNHDDAFTRPRLRKLMPVLAAEGADARNLARLAARLARAHEALERMTDGAERYLDGIDPGGAPGWDATAFAKLSHELRIRLLLRAVDRIGHEGPAELGKVEALTLSLAAAGCGAAPGKNSLKQTLAGAVVRLAKGRLVVEAAPPRRPQKSASRSMRP